MNMRNIGKFVFGICGVCAAIQYSSTFFDSTPQLSARAKHYSMLRDEMVKEPFFSTDNMIKEHYSRTREEIRELEKISSITLELDSYNNSIENHNEKISNTLVLSTLAAGGLALIIFGKDKNKPKKLRDAPRVFYKNNEAYSEYDPEADKDGYDGFLFDSSDDEFED